MKRLLLALALLLLPTLASAQAAVDQVSTQATGNFLSTLATPAFTPSAGATLGMVAMTWNGDVTWTCEWSSGLSMTPAPNSDAGTGNGQHVQWFYRLNPANASTTPTCTPSDTAYASGAIQAITFTGTHASTPVADCITANGNGTAITITVSNTTAADFVVDIVQGTFGPTGGDHAGQTGRWNGGAGDVAFGSTQDGVDGGVMSWTQTAADVWQQSACRVVAAAAASGQKQLLLLGVGDAQ